MFEMNILTILSIIELLRLLQYSKHQKKQSSKVSKDNFNMPKLTNSKNPLHKDRPTLIIEKLCF